jgi:prevent-host-death family protein
MPKTISVSEAKKQLSAILQWALEHEDGVVVMSRGEPKGVIVPYAHYQELLLLREQARRQALQELESLADRLQARNADLTAAEVAQLAEEVSQETIGRMVEQGTVTFQP